MKHIHTSGAISLEASEKLPSALGCDIPYGDTLDWVIQIKSTCTKSLKVLLSPADGPRLPDIVAADCGMSTVDCRITAQPSAISDAGHQCLRHKATSIRALMLCGMKERRKDKGDPN